MRVTRRHVLGMTLAGTAGTILGSERTTAAETGVVRRGYQPCRFGQMHYRTATLSENAGHVPLLCLHSSPNSGRIYERFLSAIGADREAVAADTPGFGDSDPPPSAPKIQDYADAMYDLTGQLQWESLDVMGYHTGSKIAVAFAKTYPRLVRRLILVSAPIYTKAELSAQKAHFGPAKVAEDGAHLVSVWKEHVRWAMEGWTLDDVAVQFPDVVRRPDISWWGHQAAFNFDMGKHLAAVRQPLLVLNPEDDLHFQTARVEQLIKDGGLPSGQYLALPGWGHGFLDVHSEKAAALVRGFLDSAL